MNNQSPSDGNSRKTLEPGKFLPFPKFSKSAIFLAASVLILLMAGLSIANILKQHRDTELARLRTIADLKALQIGDWLYERRGDADYVLRNPYIQEQFRHWRDAGDRTAWNRLLSELEAVMINHGFFAASLLDADGKRLWGSEQAPEQLAPVLQQTARTVLNTGGVIRVGPYLGLNEHMRLDFAAPIVIQEKPAAVLVLHTDPADRLDSLLKVWPVPSRSGESVLFKRDGEEILYLSDLRFSPHSALKYRMPLTSPELLAAQVLRGEAAEGDVVEGRDYRGEPAIGVVRGVKGADWRLLVKIDKTEILQGAARDIASVAALALLLLLLGGGGLLLLYQRREMSIAGAIGRMREERLRALGLLAQISDCSADAIFAKDLGGRYTLFNRAAERFHGIAAEEALGRDDSELFPVEIAERVKALDQEVITAKTISRGEKTVPNSDGDLILEVTRGPLLDSGGEAVGSFGVARDVTERKRTEAVLQRQLAELRLLGEVVTNIAEGVNVISPDDLSILYTNPRFDALFGYTAGELLGQPVSILNAENGQPPEATAIAIATAMRDASSWRGELPCRRKNGEPFWSQASVSVLPHSQWGEVWVTVQTDIGERKRMEEALRESEQQFRLVFEAAHDALAIIEPPEWGYVRINSAFLNLFGVVAYDEFAARRPWEWSPPRQADGRPSPEKALEMIETALVKGSHLFEWRHQRLNGELFTAEILLTRIQKNNRDILFVSARDISSRKAAEEELRQRNQELERFNRAMVGRELEMVKLKRQINELSKELGREPPFALAFLNQIEGGRP